MGGGPLRCIERRQADEARRPSDSVHFRHFRQIVTRGVYVPFPSALVQGIFAVERPGDRLRSTQQDHGELEVPANRGSQSGSAPLGDQRSDRDHEQSPCRYDLWS